MLLILNITSHQMQIDVKLLQKQLFDHFNQSIPKTGSKSLKITPHPVKLLLSYIWYLFALCFTFVFPKAKED